MATRSEDEFRKLGQYSINDDPVIKLPDRSVCQTCGTVIYKQHLYWPDFLIPRAGDLVEVKEALDYFPFDNLSDEQRERLTWWNSRENCYSWLFLGLGRGRLPNGRSAYLIFWPEYLREEQILMKAGQKSISKTTKRNPGGDDVFAEYRLDWLGSEIGWYPPKEHPWRSRMKNE